MLENIDHSLTIALAERDRSTGEHCQRVIGLSLALGTQIELSQRELAVLAMSARLHDIGKIGIPDRILGKPAAFEAEEWACMQQHPLIGERIVRAIGGDYAPEVAIVVRHHEQFDGSG